MENLFKIVRKIKNMENCIGGKTPGIISGQKLGQKSRSKSRQNYPNYPLIVTDKKRNN